MIEENIFQKAIDLFENDEDDTAKRYFEKIPPEEEPEVLVYLSMIYQNEYSVDSNDPHVKKLFQKYTEIVHWKAKEGDVKWQLRLAEMYLNGTLLSQSSDAAFRILEKLAIAGNDTAQYRMSEMYHTGYESNLDIATSERRKWLQISAAQGNPNAQFDLAELLLANENCSSEDLLKARKLLNSASSKGNWQATELLEEQNSVNRF